MTHVERRERRREIAELVRSGRSAGEAARTFGVSHQTALAACQEWKVLNSRGKSTLRRQAIAKLVRSGATIQEAAELVGVNPGTVYKTCQQYGIAVRCGLSPLRIIGFLLAGESQASVAREQRVSRQYINQVSKLAAKAGIDVSAITSALEAVRVAREATPGMTLVTINNETTRRRDSEGGKTCHSRKN